MILYPFYILINLIARAVYLLSDEEDRGSRGSSGNTAAGIIIIIEYFIKIYIRNVIWLISIGIGIYGM